MRYFFLSLLAASWPALDVLGQDDVAPKIRYQIDADYDPATHSVSGHVDVTFVNHSSFSIDAMPFHLYANAYSGPDTVWGREARIHGRRNDLGSLDPDQLGYVQVERVRRDGLHDLEDDSKIRGTSLWVALDPPVPPGEQVVLNIKFRTKLPDVIVRMGYRGPHVNLFYWYPALGVFDDGEWIVHEFHAVGEFFADFASFEVAVTFPEEYVCDGTGLLIEEQALDGNKKKWRFQAERVHDFALVANPHFSVVKEKGPRGTEIRYLCQPYALESSSRILRTVRSSMERLDSWLAPYPYERLIISGQPWDLGGGMEFPNLFYISQKFPNHLAWIVEHADRPSYVAIHELIHQYFYGLVATDQVTHPWLDEGLTTYLTNKVVEDLDEAPPPPDLVHGLDNSLVLLPLLNGEFRAQVPLAIPGLDRLLGRSIQAIDLSPVSVIGFPTSPFYEKGRSLLGYRFRSLNIPGLAGSPFVDRKRRAYRFAYEAPITCRVPEMAPGSYHGLVYDKASLTLSTLEAHLGWETMCEALRTYVERFSYQHPEPEDFFDVLKEHASLDLDPIIEQLFYKSGIVDFAAVSITHRPKTLPRGYVPQRRPGELIGKNFDDSFAPEGWISEARVSNKGDVTLPVDIEFIFDDGQSIRRPWDGVGSHVFKFGPKEENSGSADEDFRARLVEIRVDPDRKFPLDVNRNNNGYQLERNDDTVTTLSSWTTFWTQSYLTSISFLW